MPKRMKYKKALVVVLLLFFTVSLIPAAQAARFTDIYGHWARNDILRLASLAVVRGNGAEFNPDGAVTRAEFTAMIITALGYGDQARITQGLATGYRDVTEAHWASGFVTLARERGIITGYPDGTFMPAKVIRRDEITSVLVRALNLPRPAETDDADDILNKFTDGQDIALWAQASITSAYRAGLVSGFPDGSFKPGRFASRGETAALIKKVLAELGRQYTMYAKTESVVSGGRSLGLNVAGQTVSIDLAVDAVVLDGGKIVAPGTVKAGDYVFVNLDENGKATYIERADASYAGIGGFTGKDGGVTAASLRSEQEQESLAVTGAVQTVLISTAGGKADEVAGFIKDIGGSIEFAASELDFLIASGDGPVLEKITRNPQVLRVTENKPVRVKEPQTPDSEGLAVGGNPAKSLETNKTITGISHLVEDMAVDGTGQLIAIIDTGIDPGHPDLQKTPGGKPKIAVWKDFTGEGDIDTSAAATAAEGILNLMNGDYHVGSIRSASGRFHYGYLQEKSLLNEAGEVIDVNFNRSINDIFAVLVTDGTVAGQYDTVYLDTDGDKDFTDEKGLNVYELKNDHAEFKSVDGKNDFNLAATMIDKAGQNINVGFDGNDHGTHVAGIAAANGAVRGMAPGAQVMSLKVLDSAGVGEPAVISEAMIYAAKRGAKIINLSLGFKDEDSDGSAIDKLMADISVKYGVLFVTATGNDGPGLRTAVGLGETGSALSVGAFSAPEMWRTDYGWDVPASNLWYFSSIGPRADGPPVVSLVAPGRSVSTVPVR